MVVQPLKGAAEALTRLAPRYVVAYDCDLGTSSIVVEVVVVDVLSSLWQRWCGGWRRTRRGSRRWGWSGACASTFSSTTRRPRSRPS